MSRLTGGRILDIPVSPSDVVYLFSRVALEPPLEVNVVVLTERTPLTSH